MLASVTDASTQSPDSSGLDEVQGEIAPATPIAKTSDENVGRTILGGGVVRVAGFGVATMFGVAALSIVARKIGPTDFALFTTAMSLIAIATSFSDFGLLALGIREFSAESVAERDRSLRALVTMRLTFAGIASSGIVAFALLEGYPSGMITGLIFGAVGICGLSLHQSYNVPLHATYQLTTLAILEIVRQALLSGLMISAAVVIGSAGAVVSAYLPVGITMAVMSAMLARSITSIRPSFDFERMRVLVRDVGAFAIAASVGTIYAYVAQVFADSILEPNEAGQFALAFRVYAVLLAAGMTAIGGAFPLLVTSSRTEHDRMIYAARRLVQTSILTGFGCAVALATGASVAVTVLGGSEFSGATNLIAIIGLAVPSSFVLITGSTLLLASGRHRELVVVSVVGALASVAATAALTNAIGGEGAALGIVVGEAAIASGYLVVMHRIDPHALPRFVWVIGVVAAAAVGASPALLGLPDIVALGFGGALFVVIVLKLRLVPPEIVDRLPATLAR